MKRLLLVIILGTGLSAAGLQAGVGDPQLRTDHPWYPGELAISSFEELFRTQAEQYKRATGIDPKTDEDRALAAWFWRNTHYWHGEEGQENLWGKGFGKGGDTRTREYWTGLFAHGFGLCGTTHSQWTVEMQYLLGHARGRGMGVEGHNSFEVFLKGGAYGDGKWVLLDHDISTVIFSEDGSRLLSIPEVKANLTRLTDPQFKLQKQRGWVVAGLHKQDAAGVYGKYQTAEYRAGYAGPPPIVNLRRGESLKRFLAPGLEDGKTFVFWGRNDKAGSIPGPERPQTWVNQPEKMHGSKTSVPYTQGQARYANALYVYRPDFSKGDYREGVIEENDTQVVFEFTSPYIIGATPGDSGDWGVYQPGCRNGLVVRGQGGCEVAVSVDRGLSWQPGGRLNGELDLTDLAKGHRQYWLKLMAGVKELAGKNLEIRTVCQTNVAVLPRLKDGGTQITYAASGRGLVSAGPNLDQARAHVVDGGFGEKSVTLELAAPRGEPLLQIHASGQFASGNPPRPDIRYQIDYSTDGGKSWQPVVHDWSIARQGEEPPDFWSQSFCYGQADLKQSKAEKIRVRFTNTGGKNILRAEAHLVYSVAGKDDIRATFNWTDAAGEHQVSERIPAGRAQLQWNIPTGKDVQTRWVEFGPFKP